MRKMNLALAALVLAASIAPATAKSWADYQCEALRSMRPRLMNPIAVSCLWPSQFAAVEFLCEPAADRYRNLPLIEAEVFHERCASPNYLFAD